MLDVEYFKKIYSECSTEELLISILLKSEDFVEDALEVIKQEFQKREGDINILIKNEILKTGQNESVINNTENHDEYIGNLHLTTKGIYFIPLRRKSEWLTYSIITYAIGVGWMTGVIWDNMIIRSSEKYSEENLNTMAKKEDLPLSLFARYFEHSYGKNIEDIKYISSSKLGSIRIFTNDEKTETFNFSKKDRLLIEDWVSTHNIHYNKRKRFFDKIIEAINEGKKK